MACRYFFKRHFFRIEHCINIGVQPESFLAPVSSVKDIFALRRQNQVSSSCTQQLHIFEIVIGGNVMGMILLLDIFLRKFVHAASRLKQFLKLWPAFTSVDVDLRAIHRHTDLQIEQLKGPPQDRHRISAILRLLSAINLISSYIADHNARFITMNISLVIIMP